MIYKTTNLINQKFYIGKHQTKNKNDGYMGSGKRLKYAIKKYGIENFHTTILYECKTEKEMNTRERILVVPDTETNYNLCPGGKGGFGYINSLVGSNKSKVKGGCAARLISDETCRIKYGDNWRHQFGKKIYEDRKGLFSGKKFLNPGFSGKIHTKESLEKMRVSRKETSKGIRNSQYNSCWITDGVSNKKIKNVDKPPEKWYYGRTITRVNPNG